MKKITLLSILLGLLYLTSCSESAAEGEETTTTEETTNADSDESSSSSADEGDLVGEWKLADVQFDMEVPEGQKEMFDAMIKAMIESTKMKFNDDGTFVNKSEVMGQAVEETGKWERDGLKLKTTNEEGKVDEIECKEITDNQIIIEVNENGQNIKMTFERI